MTFDAIVIAAATSRVTVCGLTLDERARRVAVKAGASRVIVTTPATTARDLEVWAALHPERGLLVLDATDHVIHVPLVTTVLGTEPQLAIDHASTFAGAAFATGPQRDALAAAAIDTASLAQLAAQWRGAGVATAMHGELSRHPARTPRERRAAVRFLFGMIHKLQDSWLVRTINRKISYPFTRLLLPFTSITPNMLSVAVFLLGAVGCWMVTTPTDDAALYGTLLILFAGYLDACDGEIARLRLETSKLGAWLDTLADEATTVLSVTCFGIHVYRLHPETWLAGIVVLAPIVSVLGVVAIYHYLLTSTASGNSQDYPTSHPILNLLRYLVRREVINLGSVALCLFGLVEVLYAGLALGAFASSVVLVGQYIQRRRTRALDYVSPG